MSIRFKAKDAYRDRSVVRAYDAYRFTSVKGKVTDWLEKKTILKALSSVGLQYGAGILDIPCGTGRLSLFLASSGYKVTGTDISESMVELSREKASSFETPFKLDFEVADATQLPFENNSFDAIISLRLFGHVPPEIRIQMLYEFRRVSKGPLILTYYHASSLQCFLRNHKREQMGIPWYPVSTCDISNEFCKIGYKVYELYFMAKGISETVVVVALPEL